MARVFVVWRHRELANRRGEVVASGGQCVPADHPAIAELPDVPSIGYFEDRPDEAPARVEKPDLDDLPEDDEDVDED